jgi:hypothetical protein
VLAAALAGTFAVHLAAGYLANLAFAVAFIAAAAALDLGTRRAAAAGALVLAAGGLAHPLFFLLGAVILIVAAATGWRSDRAEAVRVTGAAVGAGAILVVGLLALLPGPSPLAVDTSKDGFLRRAGLTGELRSAYLDRFVHRWTRYVQWASLPLAVAGWGRADGFAGRLLRTWLVITVAGAAGSLATGLAPADRLITFGYAIPILAGFGLVRVWGWLGARRWVAALVVGGSVVAMLAGSWIAWGRQEPFMTALEVARATEANRWVAGAAPSTALVFPVNDDDPEVTFLATRAANVIRATMPPDRIRDVVIVVPAADAPVSPTRAALTRITQADAHAEVAARDGRSLHVLLAPFDRVDLAGATVPGGEWSRVADGVFLSPPPSRAAAAAVDPLEPSSPAGIAVATLLVLVTLGAAGFGWARAAGIDLVDALALAPAFGAGALILAAVLLDVLGVPLSSTGGALAASALGGAGGYLVWLILQRRVSPDPAP